MTVGFAIRSLGGSPTPAEGIAAARQLDVRLVAFDVPPADPAAWRRDLRAHAVGVAAVGAPGSIPDAVRAAATLKARAVVIDAGGFPGPADALLADLDRRSARGEDVAADPALALRSAAREALVERFVRTLHVPLAAGAPVAVRFGRGRRDLLLPEEMEWVLADLPRLAVWFDGARAERLARLHVAPAPGRLAERVAGRVVGVSVSGLTAEGDGGGHPEDDGPDWSTLVETLPRRGAWIVDTDPGLGRAALEDAVRFARDLVA